MKEREVIAERWLRIIQRSHPVQRVETKKGENVTVVYYMRFGPHDNPDWYGIGVTKDAARWQHQQLLAPEFNRIRNSKR